MDDPRRVRRGVCGRLARSQHHRHRLGFRRRGHRQHEPRADQSRLRLGSPRGEQTEGRRQRRSGLPLRAFDGPGLHNPDDEESLAATYDNGIELIKDRVIQLDWEDMERLSASLLKAMGYCAHVMPKGPDGGRDIVASPDALGLESSRIVAEVKHRKGAMGLPRFGRSSAVCARVTVGFTSPRAASPRRRATRPTAPTSPFACSTLTPSCVTTSRSTTGPMTIPAPSSRSPASGGQRRKSFKGD